jgi:hypothetical protein
MKPSFSSSTTEPSFFPLHKQSTCPRNPSHEARSRKRRLWSLHLVFLLYALIAVLFVMTW